MSEIGNEIVSIIKNSEFVNISKDLLETVLDSTLSDGILKDIPFMSTLVSVVNLGSTIKDRLFIKKMLSFLYELNSTSDEVIVDEIIKLEDDNKYRTKVGEKLLYIIDKCEDADKASLTGILFRGFLQRKIGYDEFLVGALAIDRTPLPDLIYFIDNDFDNWSLDNGGSEYVNYGLMELSIPKPKIKIDTEYLSYEPLDTSDLRDLENRMSISNFQTIAIVNWTGKNIRKYLRER